jgi:hypothetical protein
MGPAVSTLEFRHPVVLTHTRSYICCLLVKRAGCMGGSGNSDESDSEEEGRGGRAEL